MRSFFLTLLFSTATLTFVCNAQTKQDQDLEQAKKAITKSNAVYRSLFLKNDGSILSCYADDACILQPNGPALCGKEAMGKFFTDAYAAGVRGGRFIQLKVYGDGKGFVTEEGTLQALDDNDKIVDEGKYLVLWKKTKDGWKMYRDMFSSNR